MRGFLVGLILGLIAVPAIVLIYFRMGHPPVAVADAPLPFEKNIVDVPLDARIDREYPRKPGLEATEANLEIGAHIYRQQCASCHGLYGLPSSYGSHMYPSAPQLWAPHGDGVVGVSDDPPGVTYWKVKYGIRLSGMPSFDKVLNDTQMWQVTQLLASADKPLPAAALNLMKQPLDLDPAPAP
jgi:mono/diheme cytochrome c family protein